MKIKNKIMLVLLILLLASGTIITAAWYSVSSRLLNTYLNDISESTMLDAYHAFEYLLTDTFYMATLITNNEKNIIDPIENLHNNELKNQGQWNQEYLDNKRMIEDYIKNLSGYKYYICGITIAVNQDCIFSTNATIQGGEETYQKIRELDQHKMKYSIVMMEPIHLEHFKSVNSSDYVVPAVRGITDASDNIIGYAILYFDYGVIDKMFSANLPEGSFFQVVNEQEQIIFSNSDEPTELLKDMGETYVRNTFKAEDVGWTFTMVIPSEYYISGIQQTTLITGIIICVIILLAVFLSMLFVSKMTVEITSLSNCMNQVSAGNLSVVFPIKNKDEIGKMGQTFNYMVIQIQNLMEEVKREEKQRRKTEIAFLQAQINPHFISNVLNNVVWMASMQHADNLIPLINSLNSLLQNVMHQEDDLIPLRDELDYVDNYITLMEYNGSYDFLVKKEIDEDTKRLLIPRFILQPILENAILHGLPEDLSRQGCIRISAIKRAEQLQIIIEDNGDGITKEEIDALLQGRLDRPHPFNGIGVTNVNERIQLFFGSDYGLHYESRKGEYTRCIFILPITEAE